MLELFQKIPVAIPNRVGFTKKLQILLTDIGGKCFMEKYESTLPPIKRTRMSKE